MVGRGRMDVGVVLRTAPRSPRNTLFAGIGRKVAHFVLD